ncbi:MAG: NAD(P)-dependent glycerol-3-phosphate dehydrogenase [Acidobacteria bacterium]|nr:NAD(P)-dependent glycerol-3-phosphate dehydrogenase [Acidobacteriota bacterium]
MERVTVIGSGSWGTALAVHLGHIGHDVTLWARDAVLAAEMAARCANPVYLPDITFPPSLRSTARLEDALAGAGVVVVAVPSHGVRAVARQMAPRLAPGALVVSATKGIEEGSLLRMSEVLAAELPSAGAVAVISGPSFALELARGLPTAVVVASASPRSVERVQAEFRSPSLRLYGTPDLTGVEIGGALKNTIAIAAGVVEGLGQGHNALAALITRGLAEVTRLAVAMGGQRETLAGLAGLGDLVLTCTGGLSRNRHVGAELARGRSLGDVLASTKMVAEGVRTTDAALALAARHGVELPIAEQVSAILSGRKDPPTALRDLMGRRQKAEHS